MSSMYLEISSVIIKAWKEGGKKSQLAIILALTLASIGALVMATSYVIKNMYIFYEIWYGIGTIILVSGAIVIFIIITIQNSKNIVLREKKIEEVERRVQENPKEPQVAWELARIKLESYLNKNLTQVRSIFWLTVLVMACGFTLIGIGVFKSIQSTEYFDASLLTTGSGVIVSFIGGTFLVLYKATMSQAKEYVKILERINAVGMSVQILENISEDDVDLKNKTMSDLASRLLSMYSIRHQKQSD